MIALVVIFLLLVVVAAILFAHRANTTTGRNGTSIVGFFPANSYLQGVIKKWWMGPLLLWVVFWLILYFLYPSAWIIMWRKQSLFWISQIIYIGFVFRGRNKVDRMGDPQQPMYQSILGFTVVFLFLVAVWKEAAKAPTPKPGTRTIRTTVSEPARQKPTPTSVIPEVRREPTRHSALQNKTFTMRPEDVVSVTIPPGYHVSRTDGIDRLYIWEKEQADGSTLWKIRVKRGNTPVEVALYFEANPR